MHCCVFAEGNNLFASLAGHPRLHQTRCSLRDDDLRVRRDMIAVRVRDKGKRFCVPGVEPQILFWQENPALISDVDHVKI